VGAGAGADVEGIEKLGANGATECRQRPRDDDERQADRRVRRPSGPVADCGFVGVGQCNLGV
jgi:hypothetical protein